MDGRYGVASSFYEFKFVNDGAGAKENAFKTLAGLDKERIRLNMTHEPDNRLIKIEANRIYYKAYAEFKRSRVELRDFSEQGLQYYKDYLRIVRNIPVSVADFSPMESYCSLRSNDIQISLEMPERWIAVGCIENLALILHLLDIRLARRRKATNDSSMSVINAYGGTGCWYACEWRYWLGACMICSCPYPVEIEHLDKLQKETDGVGDRVMSAIKKFLESK